MNDLAGTVVMVTGASRGLGAALSEAFARAGADLSICARDPAALESVRARATELGAESLALPVDVRDPASVDGWVRETTRRLGTPQVLINNASVLGPRVPLRELDPAEWRRVIDVNLTGTFIVCQAVLGTMVPAGRGSIVNVSSGAAVPPRRKWGAYGVAKSALDAFSLNLAAELEGTGVRVNIVDPGALRTDMRAEAYPAEDPATVKPPDAIGPLFLWLGSRESDDVTGQRFQADEWLRTRE